ncbi:hypothetical protein V0U79_04595 [Hyphobacterium sp. HN65]|uniref:Uncharacterized protein n=1 Tax=Hyphobacterium lacteum TaxID=3116575 RepID=A0ABU7LNZ0_9PROT|nr:hypothetical protein [Hyphobacterium sp. HN65]MEE2525635.1 hypothetical protein [Hyphobacterium sp. HN65]
MILANLVKAVREQNYYAVFLEFAIVILGVVIGFQITAWNAQREDNARAAALLDRLEAEITDVLAEREGALEYFEARQRILAGFNAVLTPGSEEEGSDALCNAIDDSHIYIWGAVRIPVLEEIRDTGDIRLLTNARARNALVALDISNNTSRDRAATIRSVESIIRLQFPDLLTVLPFTEGEIEDNEWPLSCDWQGMRENPAVFNAISNNYDRLGALLNLRQRENEALRAALDALADARS